MRTQARAGIVLTRNARIPGILAFVLCVNLTVRSVEPDLLGCWSFDEGKGEIANDGAGNGEAARIHDANWVEGVSGSALSFDGKDDYVDCGSRGGLNVGRDDFSIDAWIWTTRAETNDPIVNKRGAAGQPFWSVFIEGGRIRVYINSGGDWKHADWAVGSTHVVNSRWHHIAGVVDRRGGRILVYVDGTLDGSVAIARIPKETSLDNAGSLMIGAMHKGGSRAFPGTIDTVALYGRVLTAEEIRERAGVSRGGRTGRMGSAPTPAVPLRPTHRRPQRRPARELPPASSGKEGHQNAARVQEIRFGITADPHARMNSKRSTESLQGFVDAMSEWQPDFAIDLGDFAIQMKEGTTTQEMHDWQLENLKYQYSLLSRSPYPQYYVMGNHCVGWLKGGDEILKPEDLIGRSHGGEDITKIEFLAQTGMGHRYYCFAVKGCLFIALDGNNWRGPTAVAPGHDGVDGAYWIDDTQKAWVAAVLSANRDKKKIVFCHEELHHTAVEGSGQGGDAPFPPVGKEGSYVDNGWELRQLFAKDGNVLACFFGHKHRNRWTVYDGVHYITLAATHWGGSFAKVTISEQFIIEGAGKQKSYTLPLHQ